MTASLLASGRRCHVCGSSWVTEVHRASDLVRVSSDCREFLRYNNGKFPILLSCRECNVVTTQVEKEWTALVSTVYHSYSPYSTADGEGELVFTFSVDGTRKRSQIILEFLESSMQDFCFEGIWLDFGSGNGDFVGTALDLDYLNKMNFVLHDFKNNLLESRLRLGENSRIEFSEKAEVEGVKGYKVISLIHVFEHLIDPFTQIKVLLELLVADGILILQVPNVDYNEFAFVIGDHASHFDHESLKKIINRSNLRILAESCDLIPGESTFIVSKCNRKEDDYVLEVTCKTPSIGEECFRELQEFQSSIQKLNKSRTVGIFGTSIGGIWAKTIMEDRFDFWIDENPKKIGKLLHGKKILKPNEVPQNCAIVIPIGRKKKEIVKAKLQMELGEEGYRLI